MPRTSDTSRRPRHLRDSRIEREEPGRDRLRPTGGNDRQSVGDSRPAKHGGAAVADRHGAVCREPDRDEPGAGRVTADTAGYGDMAELGKPEGAHAGNGRDAERQESDEGG